MSTSSLSSISPVYDDTKPITHPVVTGLKKEAESPDKVLIKPSNKPKPLVSSPLWRETNLVTLTSDVSGTEATVADDLPILKAHAVKLLEEPGNGPNPLAIYKNTYKKSITQEEMTTLLKHLKYESCSICYVEQELKGLSTDPRTDPRMKHALKLLEYVASSETLE